MDQTLSYRRILNPVDFSETSRKAFVRAIAFMQQFNADLVMLHVREGKAPADEAASATTELELGLIRRVEDLQASGALSEADKARVTLEIRYGEPHEEILQFASERDVDLIVMGTHGHQGFRRLFMGSQCEKVVRSAPCDVLTVHLTGDEA